MGKGTNATVQLPLHHLFLKRRSSLCFLTRFSDIFGGSDLLWLVADMVDALVECGEDVGAGHSQGLGQTQG